MEDSLSTPNNLLILTKQVSINHHSLSWSLKIIHFYYSEKQFIHIHFVFRWCSWVYVRKLCYQDSVFLPSTPYSFALSSRIALATLSWVSIVFFKAIINWEGNYYIWLFLFHLINMCIPFNISSELLKLYLNIITINSYEICL